MSRRASNLVGQVVEGRYLLKEKIGEGTYGEVYRAFDRIEKRDVAVKIGKRSESRRTELEANAYKVLAGGCGIPELKWNGPFKDRYVLVLGLLGSNLKRLLKLCQRRFSLKTVLMLADQMIMRIEFLHSKGLLHRDIKPSNFLMGAGENSNQVYLVDFGVCKKYWKKDAHIHDRENVGHVGTVLYRSVNTHFEREQSRRDDLEALGYVLLHFLVGRLPWEDEIASTGKEKNEKIRAMKLAAIEGLTSRHPEEFRAYMVYCRNLQFMEQPDYEYLKQLFRDLFKKEGYLLDHKFDWMELKGNTEAGQSQESPRAIPPAAAEAADKGETSKKPTERDTKSKEPMP